MRAVRCAILSVLVAGAVAAEPESAAVRARDLGVPFEGTPGAHNAITDVPGVLVGQTTLIEGDGERAIRTGVTAIVPRATLDYFPAATFVLNGDAELSGAIFAKEFGMLRSPIVLTGTASNGTAFTSVVRWSLRRFPERPVYMPVVADTWDADLSDFRSFPLREEHVVAALDGATSGPVAEGNVGGGTGMTCYEFKCGIGTASRVLEKSDGGWTVGVLVQANHGGRRHLRVAGVPVGREIPDLLPEWRSGPESAGGAGAEDAGSILIVVATDAPVTSLTLEAMARRAMLGLGRTGAVAWPTSGDVAIAFATSALDVAAGEPDRVRSETLFPYAAGPLYAATVEATEEAIVNALVAGRTMTGRFGTRVHGLPHARLREVLRGHGRLIDSDVAVD